MSSRALLLPRILAPLAAVIAVPAAGQTQQEAQPQPDRRIDAAQIDPAAAKARAERAASPAYLDPARSAPRPRPTSAEASAPQISRPSGNAPTSQIASRAESGPAVAQLSKADLDATLAQLSAAERRVLLQAIEGTDICNDPPKVAAIITLCQNRLETRSQEFAAPVAPVRSAEEQLLRGDLETAGLPSIAEVIDRLARGSAASDDPSNQAIASIALARPVGPAKPEDEEGVDATGLSPETQGLVNALINQLGGRAP